VVYEEQLTEADLSTLVNDLAPVAHKWNFICLQLGVPQSTLVNIEAQPMRLTGAPQTYLQDGLFEWLRGRSSSRTITDLCNALVAPSVGENVLAEKVEESLKRKKGDQLFIFDVSILWVTFFFYRSPVASTALLCFLFGCSFENKKIKNNNSWVI